MYYKKIKKLDLKNLNEIKINKMNNSDKVFYSFLLKRKDRKYLTETDPKRIVIDYIAGQTDNFFKREVKINIDKYIQWK